MNVTSMILLVVVEDLRSQFAGPRHKGLFVVLCVQGEVRLGNTNASPISVTSTGQAFIWHLGVALSSHT